MDTMLIKTNLEILNESCEQGLNGTWDCSTDEGKQGFADMQIIIRQIKNELEKE